MGRRGARREIAGRSAGEVKHGTTEHGTGNGNGEQTCVAHSHILCVPVPCSVVPCSLPPPACSLTLRTLAHALAASLPRSVRAAGRDARRAVAAEAAAAGERDVRGGARGVGRRRDDAARVADGAARAGHRALHGAAGDAAGARDGVGAGGGGGVARGGGESRGLDAAGALGAMVAAIAACVALARIPGGGGVVRAAPMSPRPAGAAVGLAWGLALVARLAPPDREATSWLTASPRAWALGAAVASVGVLLVVTEWTLRRRQLELGVVERALAMRGLLGTACAAALVTALVGHAHGDALARGLLAAVSVVLGGGGARAGRGARGADHEARRGAGHRRAAASRCSARRRPRGGGTRGASRW